MNLSTNALDLVPGQPFEVHGELCIVELDVAVLRLSQRTGSDAGDAARGWLVPVRHATLARISRA
jgi:hypothetical protein